MWLVDVVCGMRFVVWGLEVWSIPEADAEAGSDVRGRQGRSSGWLRVVAVVEVDDDDDGDDDDGAKHRKQF